jgi:hypothetical protein
METLESLIRELPEASNKTGEPMALTIPGWNHDLSGGKTQEQGRRVHKKHTGVRIASRLRKKQGGKMGHQHTETLPTPHSTVLFEPHPTKKNGLIK